MQVYTAVPNFTIVEVSLTFCPGWPCATILLISTSCVAGITAVSHCAWPIQHYLSIENRSTFREKRRYSNMNARFPHLLFIITIISLLLVVVHSKGFFWGFFAELVFELKAYTLSHSTIPIFVKGFFEIGSHKLFAWAGFELRSS
jgi:hypothetical protein